MITFDKPLVINLKNYNEISGDNSRKIVMDARRPPFQIIVKS